MANAAAEQQPETYHSYFATRMHTDAHAEVHEKFHLFWQQGLRFRLQKTAATWHIVGVDVLSED
jgi:hypothetical protein